MALREWLFEQPPGTVLAKATVVSEDSVQATAVGVNSGTATIKSSTLHVQDGTSVEFDNAASSNAVIRLPHIAASKSCSIRYYHWSDAPSTAVVVGIPRHASGQLFRIALNTSGQIQIQNAAGIPISTSTDTVTYGQLNRFEITFTVATTTTGSITVKVYAGASTTAYATHTDTAADLGTADCSHYEFGTPTTTTAAWLQYYDSFATNNGTTVAIGPRTVSAPPLDDPVVSVSKVDPATPGGTGSITATWPAVAGAAGYRVSTPPLPGSTTSGVPSDTLITARTYTWTGLPEGTYTITVQAV